MKSYIYFSLFILFSLAVTQPAYSQFEGQVEYLILSEETSQQERTNLNMTFTKDRIFVESSRSLEVMSGISTNGILIRNDHQDFIFNTGENEAFKIAKYDIDRLADLMNRVSGKSDNGNSSNFDWENRVVETGNSKELHGYTINEFVLQSDEENKSVSIWLTDQIKVDWGLLYEAWQTTGRKQVEEDVPVELIMNQNSFPLLIEGFEDDKRVFKVEAAAINQRTFDRSKTEISPDVELLGFSDLMMNMFRQRR